MKCWEAARVTQKASRRSIDVLVSDGYRVKQRTRVLGVSSQGYYKYRLRPLAPTKMRREWLTGTFRRQISKSQSLPLPAPDSCLAAASLGYTKYPCLSPALWQSQ